MAAICRDAAQNLRHAALIFKGTAPAVTCTVATAYNGSNIYSCPGYRLPTEAEWEYAYRAGTTTAYYNGANSSTYCYSCTSLEVNAGLIGHYCANSTTTFNWLVTRPVRQKAANAWGLDDMAGNVQEWVHDGYQNNLGSSAVTNPVVNPTGNYRMLRGARVPYAWPHGMRAAYRYISGPTNKNQGIGFRLVRRGSSGT